MKEKTLVGIEVRMDGRTAIFRPDDVEFIYSEACGGCRVNQFAQREAAAAVRELTTLAKDNLRPFVLQTQEGSDKCLQNAIQALERARELLPIAWEEKS